MTTKQSFLVDGTTNTFFFDEDVSFDAIYALIDSIKIAEMKILTSKSEQPIILHINSYGGKFWAGMLFYETMRLLKVPLHTIARGMCASAASTMMLSGIHRSISKNSFMLIHEMHFTKVTYSCLDVNADILQFDNLNQLYNSILISKTNIKPTDIYQILKDAKTLNAQECLEKGLVHKII